MSELVVVVSLTEEDMDKFDMTKEGRYGFDTFRDVGRILRPDLSDEEIEVMWMEMMEARERGRLQ